MVTLDAAKGWARTNRAQPFCMCWLALSPCLCEPAQAETDPVPKHRVRLLCLNVVGAGLARQALGRFGLTDSLGSVPADASMASEPSVASIAVT